VSDGGIEAILSNANALDEKCIQLVNAANQAGGADNITCLLVRVGE
jgi:serine/threonine protein phosphatase PrpC